MGSNPSVPTISFTLNKIGVNMDIDIPKVEELTAEKREKILQLHEIVPGREVILKSCLNTKARGWLSGRSPIELVGKRGLVTKVHNDVLEAVKVRFGPTEERFWSYKDLTLVPFEKPKPIIFLYDPKMLEI